MMEVSEKKDIVGELYKRGLAVLVEKILACTDARTVAVCHQVRTISIIIFLVHNWVITI